MALNAKQQRFAAEYLVDSNATQAAIRAGYSKKTAGSIGFELLKKPEIAQEIREKTKEIEERIGFTAENVLKVLQRAVFFDPRKLYNGDGSLKSVKDLDDDTAAALAGFEVIESLDADTKVVQQTKKVKWVDKNTAVMTAMRHFGLLNDKVEMTGKDGKDLLPTTDPVETARQIAFLFAKAVNQGA